MPEIPDLTLYVEALRRLALGRTLDAIRIASPFVLRTAEPPVAAAVGRTLGEVRRLGKRIVLRFDGPGEPLFLVLHLMIAGRLQWKPGPTPLRGRATLAAFDLGDRSLVFTEAGSRHRASLHVLAGETRLAALDAGGLEPLGATAAAFREALTRERRTLKRALTDPRILAGIGNAYSDEILHAARLSPTQLTTNLTDDEARRLHDATERVLTAWTDRLRRETGDAFPAKVTAFRDGMAVHGRFGLPCPACSTPVQRIRHAENEANYCPRCQTGGRMLADRALSRLLKEDWPRTVDEWEKEPGLAESAKGKDPARR